MAVLAFRLFGPLAAWGTGEAGETERPTDGHPGRSAVFGILAAALGLTRDDTDAQAALAAGYRVAVAAQGPRRVLRDYRTVQTVEPDRAQRKTGFGSRKQALETGGKVHTMITRRAYLQDGLWRVFLAPHEGAPHEGAPYALDELAAALRRPTFDLYLGRRDCPLALPPDPAVLDGGALREQLTAYPALPPVSARHRTPIWWWTLQRRIAAEPVTLAWEDGFPGAPDPDAPGEAPGIRWRERSDEPLSRSLRRFGQRIEFSTRIEPPATNGRKDAAP